MQIKKAMLNKLNAIACKYSRWAEPSEIRAFWQELNAIGVDVEPLTNRRGNGAGSWRCIANYSINGEQVENSALVYAVYEGNLDTIRNEYTIYFS